jgi:hypothetical protein
MIGNVRRDAPALPALAERIADVPVYMEAVRDILAAGWGARGRRRRLLLAAIGHALDFETWRSLERTQALAPRDAVELAVAVVRAVAGR